jgi:hypothetical protein
LRATRPARTARSLFAVVDKASDEPTADLLTQRLDRARADSLMLRSLLEDETHRPRMSPSAPWRQRRPLRAPKSSSSSPACGRRRGPAAQAGRCACPGARGAGAPATAQPVFRYPGAGPARAPRGPAPAACAGRWCGEQWPQTLKTADAELSALSQRGEWETPVPGPALQPKALRAAPLWRRLDPDGTLLAALQPCLPPTSSAPAGRCTSAVAWSSSWH